MVTITKCSDGTLAVSGKTYDHRDVLKQLGAKWDGKTKSWIGIHDTKENHSKLKKLKMQRRCGFCGEAGHFKPKCHHFHEARRQELVQKAKEFQVNPRKAHPKFKLFTGSPFCKCCFEERDYGYEGFSVSIPNTCSACLGWCCSNARPEDNGQINMFRFTCPIHGSSMEQLLNDTRGT